VLLGAGLALAAAAGPAAAAEKVILDSDFNTIGDDGQALVMLAQAMREGKVDLLGISVVTGNGWREQEVAEALRAVERLGIADRVGVYPGALYPLLHDRATLELEQRLFGKGYSGAWQRKEPEGPGDLAAPPDGFAKTAKAQSKSGVNFIVDAVKASPHEVTILAIGPLTDLALAFRTAPEIVPLVRRIVYMGGAFDVPGNVTPAAEFNWWFDPEAARIVLREPVEHVVVPLDATDAARFGKDVYDRVSGADTPTAKLFAAEYADTFAKDPNAKAQLWDTVAAACLLDPTLATDVQERAVDVDTQFGPDYGRSLGHAEDAPAGLRKAGIVKRIDLDRFWRLYADLLTRPVGGG
jgi:inosine-uridine nucleoside N-ribohydrolase